MRSGSLIQGITGKDLGEGTPHRECHVDDHPMKLAAVARHSTSYHINCYLCLVNGVRGRDAPYEDVFDEFGQLLRSHLDRELAEATKRIGNCRQSGLRRPSVGPQDLHDNQMLSNAPTVSAPNLIAPSFGTCHRVHFHFNDSIVEKHSSMKDDWKLARVRVSRR